MIYVIGMDKVLKQIIKRLIVVILLKNFKERIIHCFINKTGNVCIT